MTRVLVVAVVVAQLLDAATWMAMPRAAEMNPLARELHSTVGWLVKFALLVLVLSIQPALRPKYAAIGELVAVIAIAAGCIGAWSNLAVLAVAYAEAPRPAPLAIPAAAFHAPGPSTGVTTVVGAASRTDAVRTPAPHDARPTSLRGTASWYAQGGPSAAAGPRLRAALGRNWRGKVVTVCASRCIPVALTDWCQCYKGQERERLIDLGLEAFALLERPSAGLLRVTIVLGPPATDR